MLVAAAAVLPVVAACSSSDDPATPSVPPSTEAAAAAQHGPDFPECGGITDQTISQLTEVVGLVNTARTSVGCQWLAGGGIVGPHFSFTHFRGSPIGRERKTEELSRASVEDISIEGQNGFIAIGEDLVRRLKEWVRGGGTLVTLGDASRWASTEKVGLIDARPEMRDGKPEGAEEKDKDKKAAEPVKPFDYDKAIQPDRERPENTPGSVLRVELDTEHYLSSGTDGEVQVMVEGRRVFTPVRLDQGALMRAASIGNPKGPITNKCQASCRGPRQ